jgi:hypothetical protein
MPHNIILGASAAARTEAQSNSTTAGSRRKALMPWTRIRCRWPAATGQTIDVGIASSPA